VHSAIGRYAGVLGRLCRSDPYNWFNFHDFWRPPGPARVMRRFVGPLLLA
jgi:predicted LPLAT superfamily acyltransferase